MGNEKTQARRGVNFALASSRRMTYPAVSPLAMRRKGAALAGRRYADWREPAGKKEH